MGDTAPDSHRKVIGLWPSLKAFADDLDVDYGTAKAIRRRNSIQVTDFPTVVEAALRRSIPGITYELLARTARRARQRKTAAVSCRRTRHGANRRVREQRENEC